MTYYLLAALFDVWMLYDAFRRRAPAYWFLVIVLVPSPLGGIIYYVAFNWRRLSGADAGPSRSELEARAQAVPSVENLLALAEALEKDGAAERAETLFRAVLGRDPASTRARHGLSRALLGLGRADEACGHLAQLLAVDSSFANYAAALDYAEALAQSGSVKEAVALLDGLVNVVPRINHRVALAHYLVLDGQLGEAREELERALQTPPETPENQAQARWRKKARQMLREISTAR